MSSFIALGFLEYLVIRYALLCCFLSFWFLFISLCTHPTVFTTTHFVSEPTLSTRESCIFTCRLHTFLTASQLRQYRSVCNKHLFNSNLRFPPLRSKAVVLAPS
jgi:hypothetical protein